MVKSDEYKSAEKNVDKIFAAENDNTFSNSEVKKYRDSHMMRIEERVDSINGENET